MFPVLFFTSTSCGQYIRPPPHSDTGGEERNGLQLSALCYSAINSVLCATVTMENVG